MGKVIPFRRKEKYYCVVCNESMLSLNTTAKRMWSTQVNQMEPGRLFVTEWTTCKECHEGAINAAKDALDLY